MTDFPPAEVAPAPSPYREAFKCFVPTSPDEDPEDHEHDWSIPCDYGYMCNQYGCGFRTDQEPCPDHAPLTAPPGLRLVECSHRPRHYLFAHDRDDYGHGCPVCRAIQAENRAS